MPLGFLSTSPLGCVGECNLTRHRPTLRTLGDTSLDRTKIGQAVRAYGPESHLQNGTPTMGGVLILISIGVSTLLWADWTNRFVWVVLLVTFGFGWIGWADDYKKVVNHDPEGMSSRQKFFGRH